MEKIDEWCPYCEMEVELNNVFVPQMCPNCLNTILPCSMCSPSIVDCNKCPLHDMHVKELEEIFMNLF